MPVLVVFRVRFLLFCNVFMVLFVGTFSYCYQFVVHRVLSHTQTCQENAMRRKLRLNTQARICFGSVFFFAASNRVLGAGTYCSRGSELCYFFSKRSPRRGAVLKVRLYLTRLVWLGVALVKKRALDIDAWLG